METENIPEKLLTEARSRMTWGHDPATVEQHLRAHGVSPEAASQFVTSELEAQHREGRTTAIRKALSGVGLFVLGVVMLVYLGQFPLVPRSAVSAAITLILVGIGIAAWGLGQIIAGGREVHLHGTDD